MQKDPNFCKTKEKEMFSLPVPFFFPHNNTLPYGQFCHEIIPKIMT